MVARGLLLRWLVPRVRGPPALAIGRPLLAVHHCSVALMCLAKCTLV